MITLPHLLNQLVLAALGDVPTIDTNWFYPLLALVVAIGGAWWVQRATGAKEITEATKTLLGPLTERIKDLELEKDSTSKKLDQTNKKLWDAEQAYKQTMRELDTVKKLATANGLSLELTQKELSTVKEERAKDRRRLTRLENWAKTLRQQVIDLGGEPVTLEAIEDV